LTIRDRVVGNDVTADEKLLAIITGANRGGKSTFLLSVGVAQMMMQCGMFVSAASFPPISVLESLRTSNGRRTSA
jgi:DNA mismatch repair ATPase MutS